MFTHYFHRNRNSQVESSRQSRKRRERRRLSLEVLEPRQLLATAEWTAANGGDWSAGANWNTATPPTAMDDSEFKDGGFGPVTIDAMTAVAKTVLVNRGFNFQDGKLTFDLKGHTLTSNDLKIGTTVNSFLDVTTSVPGGTWELGGSGEAVEIGKDVAGVFNVDTRVTLKIFNEVHVGESSQGGLAPESKFTVTGNSTVSVDGEAVKLGYGTNTWGLLKISDRAIFSTIGAAGEEGARDQHAAIRSETDGQPLDHQRRAIDGHGVRAEGAFQRLNGRSCERRACKA